MPGAEGHLGRPSAAVGRQGGQQGRLFAHLHRPGAPLFCAPPPTPAKWRLLPARNWTHAACWTGTRTLESPWAVREAAWGRGRKPTSRRLPREVRRACFRGSGSVARSRLAPLQRRRRTAKVAAPAVPVLGRLRRPIRGRDRPAVLRYARCERGVYTAKAERKERTIRGNELEICRFHVSAQAGPAGGIPCQNKT